MAKKTILVTDDEQGYRDMLQKTLTQRGFDVVTASSGVDALGMMRKHKVDLVLTDMKMPNSDGTTLVIAIKKYHAEIPVIVMTGFAIEENIQKVMDQKVSACLKKPFSIDEAVKAINAALRPAPAGSDGAGGPAGAAS